MKKFSWIIAMFAVLALLFVGCPGEGDNGDNGNKGNGGDVAGNWFLGTDDDGTKAANNKLTLTEGDNYVRIFFDPPGKNFDKIKINFTCSPGANFSWQNVRMGTGDNTTAWGQSGNDYIDFLEAGPIEVDPLVMFTSKWGEGPATVLIKAELNFLCLRVTAEGSEEFTLTGVEFTGL